MHVVTLTVNEITSDTRVKRQALMLARGGFTTTVLARAPAGEPDVRPIGRAVAASLEVPFEVQSFVLSARRRRRAWRPLPAWLADAGARELHARRRRLRAQTDALLPGRREVPAVAHRARQVGWRAAAEAAARVDGGITRAWGTFDEHLHGSTLGARWRSTLDGLVDDVELAMGPALDALAPDVIHAHDMYVIAAAVNAALRARRAGRDVKVVYDAHEYVPGLAVAGSFTPRSIAAWAELEREFAPLADRVIAVSPGSARAIESRLGLPRRPDVVHNVPVVNGDVVSADTDTPSLREVCGISRDVPLLVYSGGIREVRGIDTAIDALEHLPHAHLAVVCVPHPRSRPVSRLRAHARARGVEERVHFVDPVPPEQVVPYLVSADAGLIPMQGGWRNHELTLPNKLFEYVAAGVPLVVSDLESLGSFVRDHGIGETFPPGDAASLARSVGVVLSDREPYLDALRAPDVVEIASWRAQERVLHRAYAEMLGLGELPTVGDAAGTSLAERPVRRDPALGGPHVLIGPLNRAGLAGSLARALRRAPGVEAESFMVVSRGRPPVDLFVERPRFRDDVVWRAGHLRHLLQDVTHVLVEDALSLAGGRPRGDEDAEVRMLADAGVRLGVLVTALTPEVLDRVARWRDRLDAWVFVADPGMDDRLPGAAWLPAVVEGSIAAGPRWDGVSVPVVAAPLAQPTTQEALRALGAQGRLRYVADGPTTGADLVVVHSEDAGLPHDVLVAMAHGAAVVGAARGPSPHVPAVPQDVDVVLHELLTEPERALAVAREGLEFVREVHDGRRSVAVLTDFLGASAPPEVSGDPALDWAAATAEGGHR